MTADCPTPDMLDAVASGSDVAAPVRQHVEACDACRAAVERLREDNTLLGRVAKAFSSAGEAPPKRQRQTVREGLIPGYLIKEEIHRGGQGVVYKAVQVATNRPVAIKMLLGGSLATGRQRRRFEREIEIVAGLRHPGIVTVYESGITPDGRVYLAMEFIDGQPLDLAAPGLPGDPRSIRERIRLMVRVCEAVQYAHQRGVIHRDLKPGNILIDGEQRPHVVDFGLAKPAGESAELAAMTRSGEFVGTIAYASPEQVARSPDDIGTLTDVYSLGVILYELLTGTTPYPVDGPLAETVRHVLTTPPRPPQSINRAIDGEAATIVLKALAKEPSRRYTSARALGADLDAYLAGHAIEAKRDSTMYVLRKAFGRHRWAFSGAAAGVIALAGVAATMSVLYTRMVGAEAQARERLESLRIAEAHARERLESLQLAESVFDQTLSLLDPEFAGPVDGLLSEAGSAGSEITLREAFDILAPQADHYAAQNPRLGAVLHSGLGRNYSAIGLHERAIPHLRKASELFESIGEDDPETLTANRAALGWALTHQGKSDEAVAILEQARVDAHPHGPRAYPRLLFSLATAHRTLRHPDEADKWYALAAEGYAAPRTRDDDAYARVVRERAILMRAERRDQQWRVLVSGALDDLRARDGRGSAIALLLVELAYSQGMREPAPPDAEKGLDEAMVLCRADPGGAAAITLIRALRAKVTLLLPRESPDPPGRGPRVDPADLAAAESHAKEATDLAARVLGESHAVYAETLVTLARIDEQQDDLEGAAARLDRAIAILRKSLGPRHAFLANVLQRRAAIARRVHKTDDCIRFLREALEAFGPADEDRAPRNIVQELGMALLERATPEQAREAEVHLRQALGMADSGAGRTPEWMPTATRAAIGRALVLQGKAEEGYTLLHEAYTTLADLRGIPPHKFREVVDWLVDACRQTGREEEARVVRESAPMLAPPPPRRDGRPR